MNELENCEGANVVMFPASKRAPVVSEAVLDDPLDELLNEFSYLTDEASLCDEDEIQREELEMSLACDLPKIQKLQSELGQLEIFNDINDKLRVLQEAKARMKHMINEMEFYIPKSR